MPATSSAFFVQAESGDFAAFFPRVGGGLELLIRQNNVAGAPWRGPVLLCGSHHDLAAVTAAELSIAGSRAFHTISVEGGRLVHDWGVEPTNLSVWHGPTVLPGSLTAVGAPAMAESDPGVLHVVAPVNDGGMAYWQGRGRTSADASDPARPPVAIDWSDPVRFASGDIGGVSLVYGPFGNLELVARLGSELAHYYRDGETGQWHGPFRFAEGATGRPSMLSARPRDAFHGNFEVVCPLEGGGLGHWTRDNNAEGFPWRGPVRFGEGNPGYVGLLQAAWDSYEVLAVEGERRAHYWSEAGSGGWNGPFPVLERPAPRPEDQGACAEVARAGMTGVHATLMRTGEVLLFGFGDEGTEDAQSRVFDPVSGAVQAVGSTPHVFCSGHAVLADGRVFAAGGHHHDLRSLHTFDPVDRRWRRVGSTPAGRWYPTCCPVPGAGVLTVGGTQYPGGTESPVNNTLQKWDSSGAGPESPIPVPFSAHFGGEAPAMDTYPLVASLPSGKVLVHSRIATRFWDPATREWDTTDLRTQYAFARTYPGQGAGVLLPLLPSEGFRARFMLIGGCGELFHRIWFGVPATRTAEILDLGADSPAWRYTAPMSFPRVMCDAVLLPDGNILVVGGSAAGAALSGVHPVLEVELFNPRTEEWRTLGSIRSPRLYHASAILLPDGRVLITGKDGPLNPFPYRYPEHRLEVFSPPYLFRGARPEISSVPGEVRYGSTFTVGCAAAGAVASAALLRPESATHSVHMDQRYVGLTIESRGGGELTLAAPPDSRVAPEGYYLLFLLSEDGVPSVGKFVRVR